MLIDSRYPLKKKPEHLNFLGRVHDIFETKNYNIYCLSKAYKYTTIIKIEDEF